MKSTLKALAISLIKKFIWVLALLCLFILIPINIYAACGGSPTESPSGTWTCYDATYDCVNDCIANYASSEEIVIVPAGTETWGSTLAFSKAITLQGDGIGSTNITGTIYYTMPTPSVYTLFRITGFSLTGQLKLYNQTQYTTGRIRVDHNNITNSSVAVIRTWGNVYGVIDNNVLSGRGTEIYGADYQSWGYITFAYGTGDTLFIEDNEYTLVDSYLFQVSGYGAMVVWRYNDLIYNKSGTSNVYMWDLHGDQSTSVNYSIMGEELYGNDLTDISSATQAQIIDHRGGSAIVFWNKVSGVTDTADVGWYKCRNECEDCGGETYPCPSPCAQGHTYCSGPGGQPQHVSDSYYWNNRYGVSGTVLFEDVHLYNTSDHQCIKPGYHIAQNQDFWIHNESYNGTTEIGVYCGTTLPGSCTTDDGAWITTQGCDAISDDNVGKNPATPISGTFYKCTSTDTWELYYTPYTYPHPLRGERTMSGGILSQGAIH